MNKENLQRIENCGNGYCQDLEIIHKSNEWQWNEVMPGSLRYLGRVGPCSCYKYAEAPQGYCVVLSDKYSIEGSGGNEIFTGLKDGESIHLTLARDGAIFCDGNSYYQLNNCKLKEISVSELLEAGAIESDDDISEVEWADRPSDAQMSLLSSDLDDE